jgi:arabinoxylan arabinofuranohydrolase
MSQHYAADPAAVEFNGRIYLYCSNDEENYTNSYTMTSLACFSTDDLKNWTDHGVAFDAQQNTSWASLTWAPSAVSNDNRIYLYFANGAGSIGVATSSVPTGPFQDARGSSLINGSTPGASSSTQWLFDPCAFIDDDGQAYVYFGGQYPTNARIIRLNTNLTSVSGSALPMFATNFFEASYMHKRGSTYYYTYCNRFDVGAAIYCETNSNPTNGFAPQGTVLANPPQNVNNNNHHSIFQYRGNWYIAYHNRAAALANGLSNPQAVYKRSICLDALNYNANGSIQQVTPTTNGLAQLKNLNPYNRVEGETIAQQLGTKTEVCSEGGMNVTSITNGSWIRVRGIDFGTGASNFVARVASAGNGGNIELRIDSLGGTIIGMCAVPPTGGWQSWTSVSTNVGGVFGVHDLYLRFTGGASNLFNLNWWQFNGSAESANPSSLAIEAESGTLGSDWALSNSASPVSITITSNTNTNYPGTSNRVATYAVTFPTAGTYNLYARLRVGPDPFNDDSMFYGNGFGTKSPSTASDWLFVNGLGSAGFSNNTDVVTGGGSLGGGMWKWIDLSQFTSQPGFTVSTGSLTQTFQIGARENGLDLDKFVFGTAGYTFSVSNLDNAIGALSLSMAPNDDGQLQISWPTAAGYVLEETSNLAPPVVWSQTPGAVNSSNGQSFVIVTNAGPVAFYRLSQ